MSRHVSFFAVSLSLTYLVMLNTAAVTECIEGDGQSYAGTVATTQSGYTCQTWSQNTPHQYV